MQCVGMWWGRYAAHCSVLCVYWPKQQILCICLASHFREFPSLLSFSAEQRRLKVQTWIERLHKLKLSRPRGGEPMDPEHGRFPPKNIANIDQVGSSEFALLF
jgi:hypothetical protein